MWVTYVFVTPWEVGVNFDSRPPWHILRPRLRLCGMETESELRTVDGVEVRWVKPGICVREDEWQEYLKFNKVRSTSFPRACVLLMLWQPLKLSYMFEHEPFKELPEAYIPSPDYGHYPPTLIFGFPISRDMREFRRIALDKGFVSAEEYEGVRTLIKIRLSVLRYLNEQCGLKLGGNIIDTGVSSLSTNVVLELKTNYRQRIPQDKLDDVIRVLKNNLPETEPRWFLEADIDQKRISISPSEFLVVYNGVTRRLTRT